MQEDSGLINLNIIMKSSNNKKHSWTKKQAQSASVPNFGKKYIGEPELFKMIGSVKNKKILELGSGNGYWLELLTKRGAECTGIEISEEQLKIAKQSNPEISYIQGDITKLYKYKLEQNTYDIIFLEHVLLEISSIEKIKSTMKESYKLLKKSGIIVVSELHPFAPSAKPGNIRAPKDYNYFSSGSIIEIVSKRVDGGETVYRDFHWTLSDLSGSLTQAGLHIIEITEPRPSLKLAEKYPELSYRHTVPMSFWVKAIKP